VQLAGDRQRRLRVCGGMRRVRRALGLLHLQPAPLGHRSFAVEQPARPCQPAVRRGRLAVDPVLAREVDRQQRRATRVTAPAEARERAGAPLDRGVAVGEPPERLAEAVLRVGIVRVGVQRLGEQAARGGPVGPVEGGPRGLDAHADRRYGTGARLRNPVSTATAPTA
jgi:hypothetical protein